MLDEYVAPPTISNFMHSNAQARWIVGPLGSGKSLGCIMELVRRMSEQAPDANGIRPTRFVIVRNTLPQLKQTVLADIKEHLSEIINFKVTDSTIYFDLKCEDGTQIKSEWLLIPLDTTEDVKRLLSLQLTGAWIEEFREVDYSIVSPLIGRLGRFPSIARVKYSWKGIIGSSNPFPEGSLWHENLVLNLPEDWDFFHQPGGLSDRAENVEHLPKGYYQDLMRGATQEFIDVHVHSKFGEDRSGQAVFSRSYVHDFHSTPETLVIPEKTFVLGADFARSPAVLIAQIDPVGRLLVHKELFFEGIGTEQFYKEHVIPELYNNFPGECYIIGDPSGVAKSDNNEESTFDVLRRLGLSAVPAPSNRIDPRIRAVEERLAQNIGGKSAVLISRKGCPMLIRALRGEYKFKRKKDGQLQPEPDKIRPWADLADAFQYLCQGAQAEQRGRPIRPRRRSNLDRPRMSAAAWT